MFFVSRSDQYRDRLVMLSFSIDNISLDRLANTHLIHYTSIHLLETSLFSPVCNYYDSGESIPTRITHPVID